MLGILLPGDIDGHNFYLINDGWLMFSHQTLWESIGYKWIPGAYSTDYHYDIMGTHGMNQQTTAMGLDNLRIWAGWHSNSRCSSFFELQVGLEVHPGQSLPVGFNRVFVNLFKLWRHRYTKKAQRQENDLHDADVQ